jgi:glycerol kinase
MWRQAARYEPGLGADRRDALLAEWHRALDRSRGWARPQRPASAA